VEGEPWTFQAWRAEPAEGGAVLRLRNLRLWPATWETDTIEAREEYRRARLEALASRLDVAVEEIEALQGRPVFGPPYLVVLEVVEANSTGDGTVLGVARGASFYGPQRLEVGAGRLPAIAEPLYRASASSSPLEDGVQGESWEVSADGEFFLLATGEGSDWRAGVGSPLWSDGEYLLNRFGRDLLLYDFRPR
jgi:hypothetical protein